MRRRTSPAQGLLGVTHRLECITSFGQGGTRLLNLRGVLFLPQGVGVLTRGLELFKELIDLGLQDLCDVLFFVVLFFIVMLLVVVLFLNFGNVRLSRFALAVPLWLPKWPRVTLRRHRRVGLAKVDTREQPHHR